MSNNISNGVSLAGFTRSHLLDLVIQGELKLNSNGDTGLYSIKEESSTSNFIITRQTPSGETTLFTLTPTGTLTITGGLTITGELVADGVDVTTGNEYQINNVSVLNATTLGTSIVNSSLTNVGTLTSLAVTGDLTVDTTTLHVDSTNDRVGVGTITPLTDLHIVGTELSITNGQGQDEGIFLIPENSSNSQGGGRIFFKENEDNTFGMSIGFNGGDDNDILDWKSNTFNISAHDSDVTGVVAMTILRTNGNIGIGIDAPTVPLDVVGDINTSTDYNISGTQVLSSTTLGSAVVNSSLTNLGTLSTLTVSTTLNRPNQRVYITDEKSSGSNGGASTGGSFTTRGISNSSSTPSWISFNFSSNTFTLKTTGEYHIYFSAPSYRGDEHKIRLFDVSNTATEIVGTSEFSDCDLTPGVSTNSFLEGIVDVVSINTVYRLEHFVTVTKTTNGFGLATSSGEIEIYAMGWVEKLN